MLSCEKYNVKLDHYEYIKLFNFIYCNAYNKGGNEYTVMIVQKPMGIVIDSNSTDNYIRIDDVNADLKSLIHPGDALIEIDNNVILGESYRNIKIYMESAMVPFTIRLRNTKQYDTFLSTFLNSTKKPSKESVEAKHTVLRELVHYYTSAVTIQHLARRYLKNIMTIRANKAQYDFVVQTLIDHTITFYSKKSVIDEYYSNYHDSFNVIYASDFIDTNEVPSNSHQHSHVMRSIQILQTHPPLVQSHTNTSSIMYQNVFDIMKVGLMVRIHQPLHLHGMHIPFINSIQTRMTVISKLWFCRTNVCFKYKYFGNNADIFVIKVSNIKSINIKIPKLSATIVTKKCTIMVQFDNTLDVSMFNKLIQLIHS